ncbi:CDPK-related protein kinase [Dissostichus eleginoides]|uniref:CDPK-related protein kinase n=1 Tax=Dissostichus eleginoides TaxID=100907 RepID=A0AAD9FK71_DISEL|nr:CDPK-related protein kinase [Dissostichus eleginoides]
MEGQPTAPFSSLYPSPPSQPHPHYSMLFSTQHNVQSRPFPGSILSRGQSGGWGQCLRLEFWYEKKLSVSFKCSEEIQSGCKGFCFHPERVHFSSAFLVYFAMVSDEIALVVLSSLVLSDGYNGGRARDDEGFWGNIARFQVLRGSTRTAGGAIAKVPAVAVDASTHWGGNFSPFSI